MAIMHCCPGCGKLIPVGIKRCPDCVQQTEILPRKRANTRDPKLIRFYKSKEWRAVSMAKLDRDHMCEAGLDGCQHIACEVHHVKPLRTPEGWNERLEWKNLMSVCTRCHNKLDNKWGKRVDYDRADKTIIDFKAIEGRLRSGEATP